MPSERFVLDEHEVTVLNHVIYALTEQDDFERLVQHPGGPAGAAQPLGAA